MSKPVNVRKLTEKDLRQIWRKLRPYDREELELQGYTEAVVQRHASAPIAICATEHGQPFACFGASKWGNCVFIWAFGTNTMNKHLRLGHRVARSFLRDLIVRFPGSPILAEVWERHSISIQWLRRLGFRPTPDFRIVNGETLRIVELRGALGSNGE